jgi:hypothetical protein
MEVVGLMAFFWSDIAGDGLANNQRIFTRPPGRVGESFDRLSARDVFTLVTATTYFTSVFYEKGQTVTNLGFYVATAAVTPTSSWMGLWTHVNPPAIPTTYLGQSIQGDQVMSFSSTRTLSSATLTANAGATPPTVYPMNITGRFLTSTGVPASRWVRSQTTSTLVLNDGTSVTAGTSQATIGQFAGNKYNIGFTTNGTTGAIPIGAWTRPLSPGPIKIAATGLYMHSVTVAATTMPALVCMTGAAGVPLSFYSDNPAWSQSHVSGTTNNTAPGVNPSTGATSADLRTIFYTYST